MQNKYSFLHTKIVIHKPSKLIYFITFRLRTADKPSADGPFPEKFTDFPVETAPRLVVHDQFSGFLLYPLGEKIRVLEQRVNGWSKVLFQNQEGYIKSEYLQMAESAAGATVIGTVTATTNINIRVAASETAEKLGVLAGGDTVDLIATENGWCKIIYQGQIAYVKEDFVE